MRQESPPRSSGACPWCFTHARMRDCCASLNRSGAAAFMTIGGSENPQRATQSGCADHDRGKRDSQRERTFLRFGPDCREPPGHARGKISWQLDIGQKVGQRSFYQSVGIASIQAAESNGSLPIPENAPQGASRVLVRRGTDNGVPFASQNSLKEPVMPGVAWRISSSRIMCGLASNAFQSASRRERLAVFSHLRRACRQSSGKTCAVVVRSERKARLGHQLPTDCPGAEGAAFFQIPVVRGSAPAF